MFKKLLKETPKEYLMFGASLLMTTLFIIFYGFGGGTKSVSEPFEIGLTIPKGFVLIPIELQNSSSLSTLIQDQGVIDVFMGSKSIPIVENLRIIKVRNDIGPVFGALSPTKDSGYLQEIFAKKNLRGTLKPSQSSETIIRRLPQSNGPYISETFISEDES